MRSVLWIQQKLLSNTEDVTPDSWVKEDPGDGFSVQKQITLLPCTQSLLSLRAHMLLKGLLMEAPKPEAMMAPASEDEV